MEVVSLLPKKGVAIAVDNHLRKGHIEIDSSPDVNRNLTPMCHRNLTKEWEQVSSKIKRLHDDLEVTAAKVCVTAAKLKLVLFTKVPMLKPGEYELCRMRMEQYIQMNELIISMWRKEELYSWASLINIMKFKRLKRSAKSLLQAIKKRFGGNAATKKTQRNLRKQQYENFTTSSSEVLDQTFDRLQKLISQLGLWM
ncbi:hypothetical protein Tco_0765133 [Tanacetum coccineum]